MITNDPWGGEIRVFMCALQAGVSAALFAWSGHRGVTFVCATVWTLKPSMAFCLRQAWSLWQVHGPICNGPAACAWPAEPAKCGSLDYAQINLDTVKLQKAANRTAGVYKLHTHNTRAGNTGDAAGMLVHSLMHSSRQIALLKSHFEGKWYYARNHTSR